MKMNEIVNGFLTLHMREVHLMPHSETELFDSFYIGPLGVTRSTKWCLKSSDREISAEN